MLGKKSTNDIWKTIAHKMKGIYEGFTVDFCPLKAEPLYRCGAVEVTRTDGRSRNQGAKC